MAMEYEPLLNSIMALSITYMACEGSRETTRSLHPSIAFEAHGAQYLELALRGYRQTLTSLEPRTADAACFTSIILGLHALASLHERKLNPYLPPMEWLKMCKGVRFVFESCFNLVRDDPTAKINTDCNPPVVESSPLTESNSVRFAYLLEEHPDEGEEKSDQIVYADMLYRFAALVSALESGEIRNALYCRITIAPVFWPLRFIELIELRKSRALVLLAHYFGVAARGGGYWWIGASPRREIQAIAEFVGRNWRTEMAWPLEKIMECHVKDSL
jgi:hypothetical protein